MKRKTRGKRNFALSCALFVITLLLTVSCGRNSSNSIKFWHFWSEPNQAKALKELIAEFEKENNCKIETTELSWNDGKTKLQAAFNSGTAPDVLELGSDWVAQFSASDVLLQLDKNEMNLNKFVDFSKAPGLWKNNLYALPWTVDTRVLFYNKELMRKAGLPDTPPKTISEMLADAEKISQPGNIYGFGTNGSDPHRLYKKILYFMWTNGGGVLDSNGVPILNLQGNAQGLTQYLELARTGLVETQRQLDVSFAQGKVGFWISGGWLLEKIKKENPTLDFGVALLPGITADKPGISFAGGEYLAIKADTKHQELSKKFIKFLTDGANALKFCKKVIDAGFPADSRYYDDPYYKTQKYRSVFAEQLKYSKVTPVHPKWLEIESVLEDAVVQALYARKGAYQAMTDAQNDVKAIISK